MAKKRRKPNRRIPQIKITIPPGHMPDVLEAMEYDGATKLSQFALAALIQRVRRLKRMKALEDEGRGD